MKKNKLPEDKLYWLGFSALEIGAKKLSLLLNFFKTAKKAYEANKTELLKIGLPEKDVSRLISLRRKLNLNLHYIRLRENKVDCYFLDSSNYPKGLKNIDDPPFVIYCRGKMLKKDQKALAIVGSRRATFYGKSVAETFSTALVKNGFTIVSGLAYGIDTISHKAALLAGGRTIAVLGSSIDCLYPSENKALSEEICQSGAIISEYSLNVPPLQHHFPRRNRIVSGLSRGVIVVEAEEVSGALITARIAGE
ncbi:MAG: DNA-processing protein DprA, partial [Patescibacteria group bacterium]|nr:DNA-processing protein DprA [Patescibacteria group bacterium]